MARAGPRELPTRFGFLLLDDFTLISMSSAIETLRMSNRVASSRIYSWKMISAGGDAVTASDGLTISADFGIDDEIEPRTVDVHIRRLRKALDVGRSPDVIRTVRSAGYAMELQ